VYTLSLHKDAVADLDALWIAEPTVAAKIVATLEELAGNQVLLDALTIDRFGEDGDEDLNVRKWVEHWKKGRDIWRFKIWELEKLGEPYRIIYAYEPGKQRYQVLGIVHRSFNYDTSHHTSRRIFAAYNEL
jgi:hypothetical protein